MEALPKGPIMGGSKNAKRGGKSFMAGLQKMTFGRGSQGRNVGVGARMAARGAGRAVAGGVGMAARALGPLAAISATLIPVFSALKENFGFFFTLESLKDFPLYLFDIKYLSFI